MFQEPRASSEAKTTKSSNEGLGALLCSKDPKGQNDFKVKDNFVQNDFKVKDNKVVLKFLEPYDKYLFEGIIKPEDLFRPEETFSPNSEGTEGLNTSKTIVLYVLNTLDRSFDFENFTFFNSISNKTLDSLESSEVPSEERNFVLLLAPQNPEIFDKVVELFYNKVKDLKVSPNTVTIFNSCSFLGNFKTSTLSQTPLDNHFSIDFALSVSAIELFKNFRALGMERTLKQAKTLSIPETLKSLKDLNLLTPKISAQTLQSFQNEPEISRLKNFFNSDHHEDYKKRLIPLIPYVPYRLRDTIETFHLRNISLKDCEELLSSSLSLQITSRFSNEIYGKNLHSTIFPVLFAIPWTHIYIEKEDIVSKETLETLEILYNNINEIYAQKIYKTYIKSLKLNPAYSLIREIKFTQEKLDSMFSDSYKSKILKFLDKNTPAIILGIPEKSITNENSLTI